jgi:hypothetical protein
MMDMKKMLALAASVMALVAFATTSPASAAKWNATGMRHLQGTLNATIPLPSGDEFTCEVTATVNLSNAGGVASATTEEFNILAPATGCHGVFPLPPPFPPEITCAITAATGLAGAITTSGTEVTVEEAGFENLLEECPVTTKAEASGTVTGTFNNTTHCLHFANTPGLETSVGGEVFLDGDVCDTAKTLELSSAPSAEWNETGMRHLQGPLNATLPSVGAEFTCEATATVNLSNAGGVASATTEEFNLLAPGIGCHAIFPLPPPFPPEITCAITSATGLAGAITTSGTEVTVEEAGFENTFEGCPVTPEAEAEGIVTGTFNNATHCLEFANTPGLLTPTGGEVFLDGQLCDTAGTLTL